MSFEKLELLKETKSSQVWLAQDGTGQTVVLKYYQSPIPLKVYERMKELSNPHMVKVLDCGQEDDMFFVVEEYVDGVPLEDLIQGGKVFSEKEAVQIAVQLCSALAKLHSHSIIHRDLKPENVILTVSGDACLIDFHAARIYTAANEETDTRCLGTVGYAAPEQYGFCQTDGRADIYALGVLMKRLLPEKNRFSPVIEKCCEFDPQRRYPSIEKTKKAFLRRSRRLWRIGLVLLLVCLAVGGLWVTLGALPEPEPEPDPEPEPVYAAINEDSPPELYLPELKPDVAYELTYYAHTDFDLDWGIERYTVQKLSDGNYRFTLNYHAPEGMRLSIFSPPDGEIFMMHAPSPTEGGPGTLIYDLSEEYLKLTDSVTVKFFTPKYNVPNAIVSYVVENMFIY